MSQAQISFVVGEDVTAAAEALREAGAEPDDLVLVWDGDEPDFAATLSGSEGRAVWFSFPAEDEPTDGVYDVAAALDKSGQKYVAVFDAFVERSRGLRVEGRFVYNLGGGRVERDIPWTHGEAEVSPRCMRAAGVPDSDIAAIEATFFGAEPAPTP